VEIAARQYNPNPLTFGPRRTLAGWGERLCLSPLSLSKSGLFGEDPDRPQSIDG